MKQLLCLILLVSLGPVRFAAAAGPLATSFTFQGRLTAGGAPANGAVDLRFTLFDANTGGNAVGGALTNFNVAVSNGLFTTTLDFGPAVFTGDTYWIETAVRPAGSGSNFGAPLLPRQAITSAPYALFAATADAVPWTGLSGVPPDFQDGTDNDTQYTAGLGLELKGNEFGVVFAGSGSDNTAARGDHTHAAADVVSGTLADGRLSGNVALLDRAAQSFTGENIFSPAADVTGLTARPARVGGAAADVFRVENATGSRTFLKVSQTGQFAQAGGAFSADGDAQSGVYVLRRTTVNSLKTELFLDGASQRLLVPTDGTWAFDILVVASGEIGLAAGFTVKGVIKNTSGTTSLIGATTLVATPYATNAGGLEVEVSAANAALVVAVFGVTSQNVRWVATVRTSEVIF